MPDNTWYTPYILPNEDCLSDAASQGVVYSLSKDHVLKMPFQYPIRDVEGPELDEAVEQLELSECSIDSFKRERAFYELLAEAGHANIANADILTLDHGIILEFLQPLEDLWRASSTETHHRWITQLMAANARIEELGYAHGDLAVRNMGVDKNNDLKLFDFGSIHQNSDQGSQAYLERGLSRLANCLHFLTSGRDPLANIADLQSLRRVESDLRNGAFKTNALAYPIESILKLCWARDCKALSPGGSSMVFRCLRTAVNEALDKAKSPKPSYIATSDRVPEKALESSDIKCPGQPQSALNTDEYVFTPDPRWMLEEHYRKAWKIKGVTACNY